MGIVVQGVVFDNRAPDLSVIVGKITDMTGLPLSVTESREDTVTNLYVVYGRLAFACFPDDSIDIYAYRPGALRASCDTALEEAYPGFHSFVEGMAEPEGTQTVHLRGYIGQEPTLFYATVFALEALGGRPEFPITEEQRREYGGAITVVELMKRRRKAYRWTWLTTVLGVPLLLVFVPLWMIKTLLTIPWRIRKVTR
ncbi:MAG: hypothetical protein ACM3ZC_06375 [Bacteroidota bacterium]